MKKILIIFVILIGVVVYFNSKNNHKEIPDNTPDIESYSEEEKTALSYICFSADEEGYGAFDKVMFALDENERAIYAQYKNVDNIRMIDLVFTGRDFPDPGYPTYTLGYDALLDNGVKFGTYRQTHSGVYDYLEFTNSDGEVFNFTNIIDQSYVPNSCL